VPSPTKTERAVASPATPWWRASISIFFALLFLTLLLVVGLIGGQEINNIKSVRGLTSQIQENLLPEFVDSQKTLLNIENMRRLTEIAYVSNDRRTRRNARINARALVAESVFITDENRHADALKASQDIDNLVKARDGIDNLQDSQTNSIQEYFDTLRFLDTFVTEPVDRQILFDFFFQHLLTGRETVLFLERQIIEEQAEKHLTLIKDIFDHRISQDPSVDQEIKTAVETLEKALTDYLRRAETIKTLNAQSAAYWAGIDLGLKTMRDQIRLGSEHSINRALTSIREATEKATVITYAMFGLMAIFILIDFGVVNIYITRPLHWTSEKLKGIQAGKLDSQPPAINIAEISTIAALLDRFSDRLAILYQQANQLEEEAARNKDLEEIMRAVFKASLDGYIVWNGERIEQASPGILKLLGVEDEDHFIANPEDYGISAAYLLNVFPKAGQEGSVREELLLRTSAGEQVACELTHLPLIFHENTSLLSYIRDLREQKKTEEALLMAKDQAEVATRAKSEFLANMSHEIRTPMNAILGLTHLLHDTALDEHQRDYLFRLEDSADGLLRIINDILDFSKIEAGRMDMENTDFQLEDIIKSVINFSYPAAEHKNLDLIMTMSPVMHTDLRGDPVRLKQVLINLVSNAIKFTDQGFVSIAVSERPPLKSPAGVDRVCLEFAVHDTGIGLAQAKIEKLFSAFSQADASTTRKYGGTGLGLAISKRLVEMMNGRIWCESILGQGSTFYFTAVFDLADQTGAAENIFSSFANFTALVIGGNEVSLKNLEEHLRNLSFKVKGFLSPEQALAFLKQRPKEVDILLVDWSSENISGIDFLKSVRTLADKDRLPAILLAPTSFRPQAAGPPTDFNVILAKPVSPSDMLNAIMVAFGRNVAQRGEKSIKTEMAGLTAGQKGAKILLAEDNEVNQLVARKILEKAGLEVKIANNGLETLTMIEEEPFDLVLMDIQMPEMDGLEAARQLRANPKHADLPIIAMTAHAMSGDRELSLEAGMNDHVTKPINLAEFFSTLARWIPDRQKQTDSQ